MKFYSTCEMTRVVYEKVLPILPRDIGIVYGIPRSGMLPAAIIATSIGAELGVLGHSSGYGDRLKHRSGKIGLKKLLVDDSIRTGNAMRNALSIGEYKFDYTCAIFATTKTFLNVDFYGEIVDDTRLFQWNFTGIKRAKDYMWDLDGVICTDPLAYDDDGESYENDIRNNVKPLYLPQVKIKSIVTNRIEKWRDVTANWLRGHGVEYDELIMQKFSSAAERRSKSTPHHYKAEHYLKSDSGLFVESSNKQAAMIAEISKKPVLCIETMKLYGG